MTDERTFTEADLREAYNTIPHKLFEVWYSKYTQPPIPNEPPVGTVLVDKDNIIWQRKEGPSPYCWWRVGSGSSSSWEIIVKQGVDPNRRLIKAPNKELMPEIVQNIIKEWGWPIDREDLDEIVSYLLDEVIDV